jgi:hypothetical protein
MQNINQMLEMVDEKQYNQHNNTIMLEYNGCARFTIDNISIVTQP